MGHVSRHGIEAPPTSTSAPRLKSVTHVAGLKCYLCPWTEPGLIAEFASVDDLRTEFRRHVSTMLADFEPERRMPPVKLNDLELQLLDHLGREGRAHVTDISDELNIGAERLLFHFHRLENAGMVDMMMSAVNGESFMLTQEGRSELFERGMLR
jgi:DNA-binding MarR family transcriptional regulator